MKLYQKQLLMGVFLVVLHLNAGERLTKSCPDKETSVHRFLTTEEGADTETSYVRLGHYTELRCCATNFNKINWYKETGAVWNPFVPEPSQFNPLAPILVEDGQILVIKSAAISDEGNYMCALEKDGMEVDKRKITLSVAECDELARGPYLIAPIPCDTTLVTPTGAVTLSCNGYFGCGNDEFKSVTWFAANVNGDTNWKPISEMGDRYQIKNFQRNGNSELGANLTITNVQLSDLNRKFMCILSTPQIIHGETKLVVRLEHRQRKDDELAVDQSTINLLWLILTVVAILAFAGAFTITCMCIRRKKKETPHPAIPENEQMFKISPTSAVDNV